MPNPVDLLWMVNNEYRKRLAQAETYLSLLEQLLPLHTGAAQAEIQEVLRYAREEILALTEDHRNWRRMYYYESDETKKVVQSERAVNRALDRFGKMRDEHERRLSELYHLLTQIPRPNPDLTAVPTGGDLWVMTQYAIHSLAGFEDSLTQD
jgi:galactokinase